MTKNADLNWYRYSIYGIGFGTWPGFLANGEFGKYVVIFDGDNSPSLHADNRKKDLVILSESPTQGLNVTTITAEVVYSINFTKSIKKLYFESDYNGSNSFYMLTE